MPLLQESTPKREILTKVESDSPTPYSDMIASAQLLVASQLMASRMGLPTTPAFFHPGFLPPLWSANSPPSPPSSSEQISVLKSLKNNNNNVVTSSSTEPLRGPRRKPWKSEDEISTPTSSVSPPSGAAVPKEGNRDRPFTCQICNRSFNYKHVLQNHERTHTGEKPFECHQCHKKFTRDHHLKTHMRLHTGERPYQCSYCDKKFVQVANLRRHLRVHTGERPYSCDYCTARFSDSNQLKAHVDIHTNEKRFECERCHSRFRRRHHLVHHKCGAPEEETMLEPDEPEDELRKRRTLHPSTDPILTLPLCMSLPEQTEPEDLSMGKSQSRSSGHSSGDSPMSRSPSSREDAEEEHPDLDPQESAQLLLQGRLRS